MKQMSVNVFTGMLSLRKHLDARLYCLVGKVKAGVSLSVQGQPVLYSEFQDSQAYIVSPSLKQINKHKIKSGFVSQTEKAKVETLSPGLRGCGTLRQRNCKLRPTYAT